MNRRELMRLAALAGMGGVLAACGIDNDGGVVIDGPGPSGGSGVGGGSLITPKARTDAVSAAQAIEYYLAAPAGIDDEKQMIARVRAFLAPTVAKEWVPRNSNINVVRLEAKGAPTAASTNNEWSQDFDLVPIGILRAGGMLAPPTSTEKQKYTIKVSDDARVSDEVDQKAGGFYVLDEPTEILLSEGALSQFYLQRSLYYWNTENTALVPDLRYITGAYDDTRRLDALVKLLVEGGPSPWVAPAVLRFPQNSTKIGNVIGNVVVEKDGGLIVNLSSATTAIRDTNKVGSQLRWTLHRDLAGDVALQIESEPRITVRDYLADNRAWRAPAAPNRELFGIVDSQLVNLGTHTVSPLMGVLGGKGAEEKPQIESAAITADGRTVAAVRRDSLGERQLVIRSQVDREAVPLKFPMKLGDAVSRPVWLGSESVLVVIDGELWQGWGSEGSAMKVAGQPAGQTITSVAVGPDGRRLALVVKGRVYLVAIQGMKKPIELAAEGRYLPLPLRDITAVAFGAEDGLLIAGTGDLGWPYIGETNVYGAHYREILAVSKVKTDRVLSLSASPISPTDPSSLTAVYSTVKGSFRLTPNEQLTFKGRLPQATPSATPSASPSVTSKPPALSSPFFTS